MYHQSGVIPIRSIDGRIEVMIITSRKARKWIFPKGIVEPHLSPLTSAANEAYEEAGVAGRVIDHVIGTYQVKKWGGICTVTLYPMQVETVFDTWPESHFRQRRWVSINEAEQLITKKKIKRLVSRLVDIKDILTI